MPPNADRNVASSQAIGLLLVLNVIIAGWFSAQYLSHTGGEWVSRAKTLGPTPFVPTQQAVKWLRASTVLSVGVGLVFAIRARATRGRVRQLTPAIILGSVIVSIAAFTASSGPTYPPHALATWILAMRRLPEGKAASDECIRSFGVCFLALLASTLAVRPRANTRSPSASHGSAAWGNGEALRSSRGFELGRLSESVLRYGGDGHLITVAPTRTGKGVSAVIPNLLHYRGSVVVTDPKGENYAVTARRRRELGSTVHALDPFGVVGGTATFNPFDLIDAKSPDANDDAWLLADMLVVPDGKMREEAFWHEEARALLAGLILYVASHAPPELRTLPHMRSLLTLAPEPFGQLLDDMLESDQVGGLVSRAAARVMQKADRERSGVISSAQSYTHFLDSPRMATVLGHSSFGLSDLKRERVTLYLVLPPDRMDTYRAWLRLMTACSMLAMTRTPGPPRERVLFLLDEFANLGRMRPVERDISLAAGYGASFWLLLQDLAQLKGTYPDRWQTFLANADVFQTFGINDWETAEYISKLTGDATIHVESENVSTGVTRGRSSSRQQSAAQTTSEKGRRLLTADEVRRLPRHSQLIFSRGTAPVLAQRLDYLSDNEYGSMADPNPMHAFDHAMVSK
jgi:type IV secretion system protein VirD4